MSGKLTIEGEFLDKDGKKIKLKDVITEEDCWQLKKGPRWIMSHKAVQRIAKMAGISKNFDVEESTKVVPSYKNELAHIVRVTIHCSGGTKEENCVHGERYLTITGEANKINTPVRGRGYLRKMAEKRAYDIAVLEHLDLYANISSEEEADDFQSDEAKAAQPNESISNIEVEALKDEINLLVACKSKDELRKAAKQIRDWKTEKQYTPTQQSFLKELHARQLQTIERFLD